MQDVALHERYRRVKLVTIGIVLGAVLMIGVAVVVDWWAYER